MATFRQRDGRWQAIIRRVDLRASKTFSRKGDAVTWARAMERAADVGGHLPGKMAGTLAALLDRYERELWPVKRWGPTKANELSVLRRDLGARPLSALSQARVLSYVRGLNLTGGHVSSRLSYLRDVLRTARDLWGARVPLAEVDAAISVARRMKLAGPSGTRSRRPTEAELEVIVAHAAGQTRNIIDLAAIVRVLAVLPLRVSELLGIQWADLNESRRTVILRGRKHPDFRVREANTQEVPLIAFAGVDTWELIAGRPRYYPSPFPYKSPSVSTAFLAVTRACKVDDLHLHDLRAYAISRLLEGGVPIPQVALLSGHRNWRVLARHYARIDPASVQATIDQAQRSFARDTRAPTPHDKAGDGPTSQRPASRRRGS